MPRLEEIKGHGRTPSDGPTAITLTTPTPVSPSIPKEAKAAHRSTSSPVPSASRVVSGQIPSSPVSTLPTMPDVFSASSCRTSHHLEREHREALEEIMLNPGDVFAPSPDEESRGDGSSWRLESKLGEGAFSSVWSASPIPPSSPQVAAIKLMDKRLCSSNARTKIAFIREVEVLRHISHPSIVSFLASFSTQTHHCLVLERLEGGELFELMSDEDNRRRMVLPGPLDADGNGDAVGEGFVRRVFGILVKAVGWLHEVGVVHRDIKLESGSRGTGNTFTPRASKYSS